MTNMCTYQIMLYIMIDTKLSSVLSWTAQEDRDLREKTTEFQYKILSPRNGNRSLQSKAWQGDVDSLSWSQHSSLITLCTTDYQHACRRGGACVFLKPNNLPHNIEEMIDIKRNLESGREQGSIKKTCYCVVPYTGPTCLHVTPCLSDIVWKNYTRFAFHTDESSVEMGVREGSMCRFLCLLHEYAEQDAFTCYSCDYYSQQLKCLLNRHNRHEYPELFRADKDSVHYERGTETLCNPDNNGKCVSDLAKPYYRCICGRHFTGENCETPFNDCYSNPCKNGGECHSQSAGAGYKCACSGKWTGPTCESTINPCVTLTPCEHDTECTPRGIADYVCDCGNAWVGKRCSLITRQTKCRSNPCLNGGRCDTEDMQSFICICPDEYAGLRCEIVKDRAPHGTNRKFIIYMGVILILASISLAYIGMLVYRKVSRIQNQQEEKFKEQFAEAQKRLEIRQKKELHRMQKELERE